MNVGALELSSIFFGWLQKLEEAMVFVALIISSRICSGLGHGLKSFKNVLYSSSETLPMLSTSALFLMS